MNIIKLPFIIAAASVAILFTSTNLCASDSDSKVESSFKTSYVAKTYLKDDSVTASCKDGVVTLTGTVSDKTHKDLAQETAEGLPGVTKVDNQLTTTAEEAVAQSDVWIGRKVKIALLFHRNVSYSATTVDVKDGVVTLSGVASSAAEKDLAESYAKDIEGVKDVTNDMTVAAAPEEPERSKGEMVDDASITAQVRSALSTHHSTKSLDIQVVTRSGAVTITGVLPNDAEKALVTKLVTDIQGVTSVDNQTTIEVATTR